MFLYQADTADAVGGSGGSSADAEPRRDDGAGGGGGSLGGAVFSSFALEEEPPAGSMVRLVNPKCRSSPRPSADRIKYLGSLDAIRLSEYLLSSKASKAGYGPQLVHALSSPQNVVPMCSPAAITAYKSIPSSSQVLHSILKELNFVCGRGSRH